MDRRYFMKNLTAQALALSAAGPVWAMGEKQNGENYGTHSTSEKVVTRLAGMSLDELRIFHQKELDEEYLPVWDDRRIDRKYGGFMPYNEAEKRYVPYWKGRISTDTTEQTNDLIFNLTNKEMYYQGRGIWVFSYLYNNFGNNENHLKTARMAIDFIIKHCRDENGYWFSEVTSEGKLVHNSYNIYGNIYVALGFGEYYHATGDEKIRDIAIETCYNVNKLIVSPEYQHLGWHGGGNEPGTKRLGTWQHFLSALTPLARYTGDSGIELIARMCVRNILERHWHPELGVAFEFLDDRFQPFLPDPINDQRSVSAWHSIQAAWMCMEEALRIGHTRMFTDAMEMGRMSLEKCWIEGEERGLVTLPNPEVKPSLPEDIRSFYWGWGALDDALVFTLLAVEHSQAQWAVDWFNKVFEAGYRHPERFARHGLLHHPRRLFYVIDILNRIISRKGRVSNFL